MKKGCKLPYSKELKQYTEQKAGQECCNLPYSKDLKQYTEEKITKVL